ncbi:Peptidoglycan-associated lipoprotein [Alteripontixanthobacter maritimus]|uniref:Peptidoglycan-associated lipoprotein n=1 Tax=Alteripontixanthobacter maritimus TaxID=2161824 RepID=A0A369QCK7_9SPHN|nr:peptidoglycan-associated lipoprotein Pal [Alteripontixanthobacter maritimus]RDC60649.1 Peptidoglycan-associated lipoprotein [Alteripontixanthobacter maritimus]
MNSRTLILTAAIGSLALAGCKSSAPDDLPPVGGDTPVMDAGPATTNTGAGPQVGTQDHFVAAVNGQNVIYFDTDRYNIDSQDAAALQTQAQYMMQYTNLNATIEGHTDERGTREYNLALGERRANSAKNYLVSLGVPAGRLRTVSYGKEAPVALGSNAQAWAQNRRAVTVILN